ncbi:hypothetical protein TNCV_4398411 [Trichonephila clavipes]|nr:hypothetical protein TNCV_4398411 [Trichonephila clavipes]
MVGKQVINNLGSPNLKDMLYRLRGDIFQTTTAISSSGRARVQWLIRTRTCDLKLLATSPLGYCILPSTSDRVENLSTEIQPSIPLLDTTPTTSISQPSVPSNIPKSLRGVGSLPSSLY